MNKGKFITFEGCEGAGKSTQAKKVYQYLLKQGISAVLTHEPGGTEVAEQIRSLLLSGDFKEKIGQRAELLLYFASRAQHVDTVIEPALEQGKVVICDRYHDATLAYQGYGRKLDVGHIDSINHYAVQGVYPELTILIDIDVRKGIERSRKRSKAKLLKKELDRMEMESLEFHQRVRDGYLKIASQNKGRFRIFSGDLLEDELFENVIKEIVGFLNK